jgi:stage IV sporulation protein FB
LISLPVFSRKGTFFWLLRTLVTVRWSFFLVTLLLGLRAGSALAVAIWIPVVFVAILLHECGHALAARHYRQQPRIELHAMGGVTKWAWLDELRWRDRIVISLAGPAAGFMLAALIVAASVGWAGEVSAAALIARRQMLWVTVAWGGFNLLPLMPMDGGQALAEFLEHRMGRDPGRLLARKVSVVTGAAGFVVGATFNEAWIALVCALFALDNYQRMRGQPGFDLPA